MMINSSVMFSLSNLRGKELNNLCANDIVVVEICTGLDFRKADFLGACGGLRNLFGFLLQ